MEMVGGYDSEIIAVERPVTIPQPSSQTNPKRFLCRHCKRRFARHEHLQRHERTHTKDKPYRCQKCTQRFTRSDLLARHERLVHSAIESNFCDQGTQTLEPTDDVTPTEHADHYHAPTPSSSPSPLLEEMEDTCPVLDAFTNPTLYTQPEHGRNDTFPLNALSMAAEQALMQELGAQNGDGEQQARPDSIPYFMQPVLPTQPPLYPPFIPSMDFIDPFDNLLSTESLNAFFTPYNIPYPFQDPLFSQNSPSRGCTAPSYGTARNELPMAEDPQPQMITPSTPRRRGSTRDCDRYHQLSHINSEQWLLIQRRLKAFESALPTGYQLPSPLVLSRFVSAFIGGFHEHMPFLHFPTLTLVKCPVELLIAIAAVGAHYRFERREGRALFNISLAIVMERQRRNEQDTSDPREDDPSLNDSGGQVPSDTSASNADVDAGRRGSDDPETQGENPNLDSTDVLATMQTLVLLMAVASWAREELLTRKALGLQSLLVAIVRRHGLDRTLSTKSTSWETWAYAESAKRTKFIVFCYFNIQSLLYHIPSPITPADIHLSLPNTALVFEARTRAEWEERCQSSTIQELPFQESFQDLFRDMNPNESHLHSALSNYVLIHALLQQIFYARQLDHCWSVQGYSGSSSSVSGSAENLTRMEKALHNWRRGWRQTSDSTLDLPGPVAYNSVALLRLAYIRLNANVGPSRALEIRNPLQVAQGFLNSRRPRRGPQLLRAVMHSAHALSIPIKIGLKFVAQTQAIFWSILHSLCSLECAVLLSFWLDSLAVQWREESEGLPTTPISPMERRVVQLITTMLSETEFGIGTLENGENDIVHPQTLKRLSAGVMRAWAQVFEGPQTWPIVDVIGESLKLYASLLETE